MLKLNGQITVNRTPADLWKLLMDPEVLKKCIPKCEELEEIGPQRYRVALKVGFGLVKGRFQGEAELKDVVEPETYRLEVHAKGSTGFIQGATLVRLSAAGDGQMTQLYYESDAQLGGMIGSVGGRWVEGAAKSFADQFFEEIARL